MHGVNFLEITTSGNFVLTYVRRFLNNFFYFNSLLTKMGFHEAFSLLVPGSVFSSLIHCMINN